MLILFAADSAMPLSPFFSAPVCRRRHAALRYVMPPPVDAADALPLMLTLF
jgi:hypothetical protein